MTDVWPQQSVWLYTHGSESVRLYVQPGPVGFQLVIFGPGNASAEFDFAQMENLERFRAKYERDLMARGFTIQAAAERRSGSDRRQVRRLSAVERRRS